MTLKELEPVDLPDGFTCPKCNPEYWGKCAKHECGYYKWCLDRWLDHRAIHNSLAVMAEAARLRDRTPTLTQPTDRSAAE